MRYSIMLQIVATITITFLGTAALFAWLQYRPEYEQKNTNNSNENITLLSHNLVEKS